MKKQVLASLVAISLSPAAFAQDDEVKPFTMEGELGFISTSGNTETTSISAGIQAHQELEKWSNDYVLKGLYKQETGWNQKVLENKRHTLEYSIGPGYSFIETQDGENLDSMIVRASISLFLENF